jgi:hypothetical protein
VQVRGEERALPGLSMTGSPAWGYAGDDVVSGLAADENAPHWPGVADGRRALPRIFLAGGRSLRSGRCPRGVHDRQVPVPPAASNTRFDRCPAQLGDVVAEHLAEPARLQEIALHVDDEQGAAFRLQLEGIRRGVNGDHHKAAMNAFESATAPNTPPCIVIIFSAARRLPRPSRRCNRPAGIRSRGRWRRAWSYARRRSMPVRTMFSMPRWRSKRSRRWRRRIPVGFVDDGLALLWRELGNEPQPGSPRTRIFPHGPGSPMPAPMRRLRHRLLAGRSLRSGRWPRACA